MYERLIYLTPKNKRLIDISLALALSACIILSMSGFAFSCRDMYGNIIRVRIIANSNSDEDQVLKLKIRDNVLAETGELFTGAKSCEEAVAIAEANIDVIREIAQQTVYDNGYSYTVQLRIDKEYFDTREYDDFTLPAGVYETLIFTVGEGKGENWWCVLFPQVCVGSCTGKLTDSLKESSADYAEKAPKYRLKFKVVEIFQKFINFK